ncbi:MAG TPA: metalloregulator ArsR/SmtB family transcription factor [Symbiobacteriaceae bacterium]|nr:metalloregulator ArsR/SmtB family transcription factor [Symbiobacteriaceae bacterium]
MNGTGHTRDVYDAVADPTRRQLLRLLAEVDELALYEITTQFPMGRTAVSKHLAILKDAGLVVDRRVGRETRYRLNASPLKEIRDWVSYYQRFWSEKLVLLRDLLQEEEKE